MRKAYYSDTETMLRVFLFLAHAVSAVAMLLKAYGTLDGVGCDAVVFSSTTQVRITDPVVVETHPELYPLTIHRSRNATSCDETGEWNTETAWCLAQNLPDLYDIVSRNNSHTFGSSWNTIATVMMFEWISASYSLFYIDPFDSWLTLDSLWWGMHPIPVVATAWNLAMFIMIWAVREQMNIPVNNAFIFSFCLLFTIVIQNVLSISRDPNIDSETEPLLEVKSEPVKPAVQWRTDHFLRNRGKKTDARMGSPAKLLDANFHEPSYNQVLEKQGYGAIPRYLEYCITAPLLIVALFSNAVPFSETWKFQALFGALFACNLIGVSLHYTMAAITEETGRLFKAANYLFFASWLVFLAGMYVFVWTCREFLLHPTSETGMPSWVLFLLWTVLVLYSMFGFLASRFYIPRLIWSPPYSSDDWAWLTTYFDFCSLFIKLPVAWTIWVKGAIVICEKSIVC